MAIHTSIINNDKALHTTTREYNDVTREAVVVETDFLGMETIISHEKYHSNGTVDTYDNEKLCGIWDIKGAKK